MTTDTATRSVPPPVRAGIGLVAVGLDRAKRMQVRLNVHALTELPVRGLALVASARETVERTYEELSNRGETVVARWRGQPEPRQTAPAAPAPTIPAPTITLPDTVAAAVADATPGATLAHDDLPLADYDHLTLGSLRARLPRLDPVALVQLRDYERTHANRLPVLTMFENRLAKITT